MVIARQAAGKLGYEFVDEQLPVVVAKRLDVSPEDAEAAEDTRRSVGERMLSSLERATPELAVPSLGATFHEQYLAEVRAAVLEYSARGNVFIVGRGASAILGRRQDVLRIFMYAPRAWRIDRIAEARGIDPKQAAAEVDRIDAARRAHLHDTFDLAFGDPHVYDLCIDTSSFGEAGSVASIVAAVRARE